MDSVSDIMNHPLSRKVNTTPIIFAGRVCLYLWGTLTFRSSPEEVAYADDVSAAPSRPYVKRAVKVFLHISRVHFRNVFGRLRGPLVAEPLWPPGFPPDAALVYLSSARQTRPEWRRRVV